ncbi:MAG: DNA methyltransferase, partial [Kiritimatiellae bacterium]|nr:DNA methyltransferase [Kiritimatiellia bacterium]
MKTTETIAIESYVAEVSRLAKTGKATEHTFRGALAALIDALAPGLKAVNEPKRTDCGAPDYIVQDKTGLGVFYVEAKDLGDDDLDGKKRTGHKEQFDRYKAALDTIIFTDYLDFRLYRHGQFASSVRIADWDGEGKVSGRPAAYAYFAAFVADAAAGDPQKIDNAKRLAELMAGKARLLQRNAEEYLTPLSKAYDDAPDGAKPPVTPILELMLGLRDVLMPDVGADEFSDIFAQTLTYGMFAARLNDPTPEDFSRYEAMALIPKTNPFLKQLFQYVANNLEDELEWMVDDLADLFRSADVAKIMRGYGRAGADSMIHFYEDFLAAYDAGLRKDRGVWYTPIQVVKFIVGAADWALRTRFGLPDGLADRSKVEIEREEIAPHGKRMTHKVKKTVHRVQLLDPATGTGTFIAESIRQIFEKFKGNEGMWPGYVESDLLPRLNGFELLMASYTMAHIKIDFALRETGTAPSGKERFRVFLTDSLSDWHKELPGGLFASALAPEQQGADEVKRDTPVMVVMGNPPYSGISQNNGEWISKLVDDYKVEPGGKVKLQERKHWLNDDYVKFIRLAEHYVEKNGEGIVAFITPHGFLDNPTFRGMRWHLMQTFDEIWTLNLHGNSKKKEVAPDGGKDECVFNIMQGVAITLFVKKGGVAAKNAKNAKVYYADLWGKKKDKLAALDAATMESVKWQEVQPTEPMLFFTPRDTSAETEYSHGFKIDELFLCNVMGIVTARDGFVVDMRKGDLLSRIYDFCSVSQSDDVVRARYFGTKKSGKYLPGDTRGWKLEVARKKIASNNHEQVVKTVNYRPFDTRYIYYSSDMVDWGRERLMSHFLKGDNIGLCCIRICSRDDDLPVFVTDKITDKTILSSKDNANVFPLYLYEENMGKVEKRANLDKDIVAKIAEILNPVNPVNPVKETPSPEDIFDYIYGVLHSPAYRAKFKEFLKVDFPRIPYPKDSAEFVRFRDAGRELRMTHLMRDAE